MTEVDLPGIAKKLAGMSSRFDRLKRYEFLSLEDYLLDEDRQLIIERLLELIIQAAIDINKMLLKQILGLSLVSTNGESLSNANIFRLTGEYGFIPLDLAEKLAKSGQFRNVLAHLYDDIDPQQVYIALQHAFEQYLNYIEAIQDYIDRFEASYDDRRIN
jgi:uncharacterized protein YutE (UPF0331/DUF86 family)